MMKLPWCFAFLTLLLQGQSLFSQCTGMMPMQWIPASVTYAPADRSLPTIFVVGDSTGVGWGPYLHPFFDSKQVNVVVAAASGRSSRTYIREGLWDRVKAQMRPHDIVLIQFGHNDAFAINDPCRARGTLKGVGDESQEIENQLTQRHEVVHTFGWYLDKYVQETRAKGAIPIIMSLTPDNVWNDGRMDPDQGGYASWSAQIAAREHVDYVDINAIMSDHFARLGQEKTTAIFAPQDKTHLTKMGWQLNALWTFEALALLPDRPINGFLSKQGEEALPPRSSQGARP